MNLNYNLLHLASLLSGTMVDAVAGLVVEIIPKMKLENSSIVNSNFLKI